MSTATVVHRTRYCTSSALLRSVSEGVQAVGLFLATSEGPMHTVQAPLFMRGVVRRPQAVADLLLTLSQVARSRFHLPAAMLRQVAEHADPVITCHLDGIRFEAFSQCCGVYARLDLSGEELDGVVVTPGTTNVDFNPELRAALSSIGGDESLRLTVGSQGIEFQTDTATILERVVELPVRWLKGLVGAECSQSRMSLRWQLKAVEARRLLATVPRGGGPRTSAFLTPAGGGLRFSQTPQSGAVQVGGLERLRLLDRISRHITGLRIFSGEDGGPTAWQLSVGMSRLVLVLSPTASRGFSGDGDGLGDLLVEPNGEDVSRVLHWLAARGSSTSDLMQTHLRLSPEDLAGCLAHLSANGLIGYDLADSAYFHRVLPYDLSRVSRLNPRILGARGLVEAGAVRWDTDQIESAAAWILSSEVEHRVVLGETGDRCSCPWWSKHGLDRGPCKHILAARIAKGRGNGPARA